MKTKDIVQMLSALAHETRLEIFKSLVKVGDRGTCPCHIAENLKIARNTLSFHLNILSNAGLVKVERHGKYQVYSPDMSSLNTLTSYLTADFATHADVAALPCFKGHKNV